MMTHIDQAAKDAHRNPTEAQKAAGNYAKGHVTIHGLGVAIENAKGSFRRGTDDDGKPWKVRMPAHYGYINRTEGADGDHVDSYIGPHVKSPKVYIVNQNDAESGGFDEHKVFLGFASKRQVIRTYMAAFSDGKGGDRLGRIAEMSVPEFKQWLKSDTSKPHKAAGGAIQGYEVGGAADWPGTVVSSADEWPGTPVTAGATPSSGQSPPKKFGWGDTWPAKLAKSIYSAVTLPADVYAGRAAIPSSEGEVPGSVPQDDPRAAEGMDRVSDLKWLASPVSPSVRNWNFALRRPDPAAPGAAKSQGAADEFGVNLSRGQATGDLEAIRYEDMAARGAYGKPAQDRAAPFFSKQFEDIQTAGRDIGSGFARQGIETETPNASALTVNSEIAARAAEARAIQERAAALAEREAMAARGAVDEQGRALGNTIAEGGRPIENPREAGEIVGQEVRGAAARDRANYQQLYDRATALPGQFNATVFEGIGNRIQGQLTRGENPVIIDDVTTPVASRAIRDLDNISGLRIQNRADPMGQPNPADIVAIDLRGVDQARKRLVAFYRAARGGNNASDVRATGRLIDEFDNQVEGAISNGLFSGDPRALDAIRQARGAYSQYARTYRPQQAGDDVGTAMRRIIDRNATPEEIVNMVVGSGRIGNAGLPVRIADRLENVLGRDSDAWSSIRQAIWQRAAGARDPSAGIEDLVGSSLGRRMFDPTELRAMRDHARAVREIDQYVETLPGRQTAERVQTAYQEAFGGRDIGGSQGAAFRRIVDGTATPEETAQAVFGAISSGNPGNVSRMIDAIERIAGPNSDTMSAIRQGIWQKLTQNAAGKDQPGQQKVFQAINEFINGRGRTIAEKTYSPEELSLMRRYADVLKKTVIPKYARTNSDTAPALLAALHRFGSAITSAIGAAVEGVTGGLAGYAVGSLLKKGTSAATDLSAARKVGRSLQGASGMANQPSIRPQVAPLMRGTGLGTNETGQPWFVRPGSLPPL